MLAICGFHYMKDIRLAIDVESGDFGPDVIISGIIEAEKRSKKPFHSLLCGNKDRIEGVLKKINADQGLQKFEIVHCRDSILPQDKRARVWKKRADSSIIRCITLQKESRVDASVSAGDTAILMGAALFILGRSLGVIRPALAAFLPTVCKKPVLLLDVGANLNCRVDHLVSFALMGSSYVSRFFDQLSPAVALLNIGKEPVKGTRVICDSAAELQKKCKNFIGFIEGNGVLSGDADVVVCDGFTGNVLLKACESILALTESVLDHNAGLLRLIKGRMSILDPENYGAVPFLGIKGTVLKAHGSSSSRAIANAILTAITAVEKKAVWSENVRPKG